MENVHILGNVETATRADPNKTYFKISTPTGMYSCWEKEIAEKLEVGKAYSVEVRVNGKYKTIQTIYNEIDAVQVTTVKPSQFGKAKEYARDPVGLTVDLYKAFIDSSSTETVKAVSEDLTQYCITVVKDIQKAFS